jgi:hypothetical protein
MKEVACMKKVCLVNGSLRGKKASSLAFLQRISTAMGTNGFHIDMITVKAGANGRSPLTTLAAAAGADVIVIAFPLFCYSLSGAVTRFLEDFHSYAKEGGRYNRRAKVFAIVNSGFPEPLVSEEAIRVVRNFCARLGLQYRFTIAIGAGPVTVLTMRVPFLNPRLKAAFRDIARDAGSDEAAPIMDVFIAPVIPRNIILRIKEHYEKKSPALWPQT